MKKVKGKLRRKVKHLLRPREYQLVINVDRTELVNRVNDWKSGAKHTRSEQRDIMQWLYDRRNDSAGSDNLVLTWPVEWYELTLGRAVDGGTIERAED